MLPLHRAEDRQICALTEAPEFAQRQTVRTAPFQTALAVDAFEVADQQHAEVAPRRQRRTATARCILRRTLCLHEPVEVGRDQHRLQLVVEGVTRRTWHLRPGHQHICLPFPLTSKSHPPPAFLVGSSANQTRPISSTGCYAIARRRPAICSASASPRSTS